MVSTLLSLQSSTSTFSVQSQVKLLIGLSPPCLCFHVASQHCPAQFPSHAPLYVSQLDRRTASIASSVNSSPLSLLWSDKLPAFICKQGHNEHNTSCQQFATCKTLLLSKQDKSSASQIDLQCHLRRVSHERIGHPTRYFDLQTLLTDQTRGNGNPVPSMGQSMGLGMGTNKSTFRERLEKNSTISESAGDVNPQGKLTTADKNPSFCTWFVLLKTKSVH